MTYMIPYAAIILVIVACVVVVAVTIRSPVANVLVMFIGVVIAVAYRPLRQRGDLPLHVPDVKYGGGLPEGSTWTAEFMRNVNSLDDETLKQVIRTEFQLLANRNNIHVYYRNTYAVNDIYKKTSDRVPGIQAYFKKQTELINTYDENSCIVSNIITKAYAEKAIYNYANIIRHMYIIQHRILDYNKTARCMCQVYEPVHINPVPDDVCKMLHKCWKETSIRTAHDTTHDDVDIIHLIASRRKNKHINTTRATESRAYYYKTDILFVKSCVNNRTRYIYYTGRQSKGTPASIISEEFSEETPSIFTDFQKVYKEKNTRTQKLIFDIYSENLHIGRTLESVAQQPPRPLESVAQQPQQPQPARPKRPLPQPPRPLPTPPAQQPVQTAPPLPTPPAQTARTQPPRPLPTPPAQQPQQPLPTPPAQTARTQQPPQPVQTVPVQQQSENSTVSSFLNSTGSSTSSAYSDYRTATCFSNIIRQLDGCIAAQSTNILEINVLFQHILSDIRRMQISDNNDPLPTIRTQYSQIQNNYNAVAANYKTINNPLNEIRTSHPANHRNNTRFSTIVKQQQDFIKEQSDSIFDIATLIYHIYCKCIMLRTRNSNSNSNRNQPPTKNGILAQYEQIQTKYNAAVATYNTVQNTFNDMRHPHPLYTTALSDISTHSDQDSSLNEISYNTSVAPAPVQQGNRHQYDQNSDADNSRSSASSAYTRMLPDAEMENSDCNSGSSISESRQPYQPR